MASKSHKAKRKFLAIEALVGSQSRIAEKLELDVDPAPIRKARDRELREIVTLESIVEFFSKVERALGIEPPVEVTPETVAESLMEDMTAADEEGLLDPTDEDQTESDEDVSEVVPTARVPRRRRQQ
jgi:hypothetical protein